MKPIVLFPEGTAHERGCGPVADLAEAAAQPVLLRLDITRMMQQQTLDAVIWGSPDGTDWGSRPLFRLPHRYYCGTYCQVLDLTPHPDIRYLRLEYKLRGWSPLPRHLLAAFSAVAEPCHEQAMAALV